MICVRDFLTFFFLVTMDIIYIACTLLSEMKEWPGIGPVRIRYWYCRAPDPNPGFSLATYRNARCSTKSAVNFGGYFRVCL